MWASALAPTMFNQGRDGRAAMEELDGLSFNRIAHCGMACGSHFQGLRDIVNVSLRGGKISIGHCNVYELLMNESRPSGV